MSQHALIFRGHDQPIIEDPFDLLGIQMDLDGADPILKGTPDCETNGPDYCR